MHVRPISCYRPAPGRERSFVSPPYDVFDRAGAAAYVAAHPRSFLAIDRPETSFPPDHDMYAPDVYARAAELLGEAETDGTLVWDPAPCYYVYRLEQGGRAQVGVACACPVSAYLDGTVRRHESTRPEKERDRVEHIRATGAQTGPIFLTYRDDETVDALVRAAMSGDALYDFTDDEGVRQTVWRIGRPEDVRNLQEAFLGVPCSYIADGHHRAASAVRVCLEEEGAPAGTGRDHGAGHARDSFLSVLFPASQLTVLAYNRVVRDMNGLHSAAGPGGLLDRMADAGIERLGGRGPCRDWLPERRGDFGVYAGGRWFAMRLHEWERPEGDPVASLDVSILQDRVLGPILGIRDPRSDPRISFAGGTVGTEGLERMAGPDGVAFRLFPTSMAELMAVSDAGLLMPPKSTWFEPKLRSGLFIRPI